MNPHCACRADIDESTYPRTVTIEHRGKCAAVDDLIAALTDIREDLWRYLGGRSARSEAINHAFDTAHSAIGKLALARATGEPVHD